MIDETVTHTESIILESCLFRSKPQMKRLLSYLIKHTYENNNDALQQRSIAVNCLGRNHLFDSAKDPIVRIEAARLRKLLEEYYDSVEAHQAPLRVSMPKGSYHVLFSRNIEHRLSRGYSLLLLCQSPVATNVDELWLMIRIRQGLSYRLNHFDHLDLVVNFHPEHEIAQRGSVYFLAEEQHDYVMRLEVVQDREGDFLVSSIVIHRLTQEILWSHSIALPEKYTAEGLNEFYMKLISPLVADSYGILGSHWAKSLLEQGLGYVEDQHLAAVQFINLCNNPSKLACEAVIEFLKGRLNKYPDDFKAQSSYLAIGFFDHFLGYNLIEASLEDRLERCFLVAKHAPHDASVSILIGFYYFALGRYDESQMHLKNALTLNPYNTMWHFIYGGLLFFMGKKEEGFQVISSLYQYNKTPPGYYFIPVFFYYIGEEQWDKAFSVGSKVAFADGLECLVDALAHLAIGAQEQAQKEILKIENNKVLQNNLHWVENTLLVNHPDLVDQYRIVMNRLSLNKPRR